MSELSTVAIKDGHRGHLPHHHQTSQPIPNTLDAERADRISRLAGLERVATARQPTPISQLTPGASAGPTSGGQGYFDASGNPTMGRERSTVGSASATGSVGGRTTWASTSDYDADKMSESQDMELDREEGSVGGMSDDAANSLVGFGEGARTPARQSAAFAGAGRDSSMTPVSAQVADEQRNAKGLDGMTYDQGVVDTAHMSGDATMTGTETAERIMKDRLGESSGRGGMEGGQQSGTLGKFPFEGK